MSDIEVTLAALNGVSVEGYHMLLERMIRQKYSVSAELAILRQRDTKPEEFDAYDKYVEECKIQAKNKFGL